MTQAQNIRRGCGKYCSQACENVGRTRTAADPARIATRFWPKVDRAGAPTYDLGPCWVWRAAFFTRSGYGTFVLFGKREGAHRVSWFLKHGELPELQCLHRCDNRACVNPDHLFLGTHKENMADMAQKGRARPWGPAHPRAAAKSSLRGKSKLSPDDVRAIRAAYIPGETSYVDLGKRFGVTYRTVSLIVHRKIWKEVA